MRYCARCVLPDSRPNLTLDADGVCDACRAHEARGAVDWAARERALDALVARTRARATGGWDCVVPVSGGKDSTWQVVTCLERGLRPLCVTWRPPRRTPLGEANLRNLVSLGVDHVDFSVSPEVERVFTRLALERTGTPGLPMHMALFSIPLRIAVAFRIPLVVWGENSAIEYGGAQEGDAYALDARWLARFGVTHGTTAADWACDELPLAALEPYRRPDEAELAAAGVEAVFLGWFLPWDPETTHAVARAHGFRASEDGPRVGAYDYADVDDDLISVHHWFKWPKFGFTRTFDNLSLEIRNGRLERDEAIERIRARGDETPHDDIARLCELCGIGHDRFREVVERFRNPAIWTRRGRTWAIDGFLVPDWRWQ
ncbi:MAG: N-acetyl sugar amidotransferase [Thermoleophilia bacterium]